MALKILNLYSGLGGNRRYWTDCEVTSVELDSKIADAYKKQFPQDELIVGDAHEYLRENIDSFDFIWSSPPCQSHSKMVKATRHKIRKYPDMKLYEEIIYLMHFSKSKWIVENVAPYYEPLIEPTKKIGRHYFWSNFDFPEIEFPSFNRFVYTSTKAKKQELCEWYDLQYDGTLYYNGNHDPLQVLRNSVHPKVGLHVLDYARK